VNAYLLLATQMEYRTETLEGDEFLLSRLRHYSRLKLVSRGCL